MEEDSRNAKAVGERILAKLMGWLAANDAEHRWLVTLFAVAVLFYLACVAGFGTGPINQNGNDVFLLLDGAWRIINGQIPHRDFYIALGPLEYMIAAGGMLLTRCTPKGVSVGIAIAGAIVGIWGWRMSRSRMPRVPALLGSAWLALTAVCPAPIDSSPNAVSCAMIYNRLGYALLGIVLIECAFADERSRFWGGFSSGAIVILLLFLKLNFFGAAVFLLLVTVPLRKNELVRWLGILAGVSGLFAIFCLYLRSGLRAFSADMWLAIRSRSESLSLRQIEGTLPGSGEVITVLVFTVVTTLLIFPGEFRRSPSIRTILLACATIAVSGALRSTNALETGLHLLAFWVVILVSKLALAFPTTREKVAVAALAVVGLGGIAANYYSDCLSLAMLFKFRRPSTWSTGMSIAGNEMDGLRFFDNPDSNGVRHGDNGRLYASCVNDGIRLLESTSQAHEKIATVGFHNPFSYALRRVPATGGSTWLLIGNNISLAYLPPPQRIFGNADLVMEPHYESTHQNSDTLIEEAYRPYLQEHYSAAGQSECWSLYRRHR